MSAGLPAYLSAYLDLDSEQLFIYNRLLAKPVFSAVSRIYIFYFAIYSLRDWDIFSYFVKVYVEKKLKSRQFHRFHFVTCSIALCCVNNFLFSGFGIRCSTPKVSSDGGYCVVIFMFFSLLMLRRYSPICVKHLSVRLSRLVSSSIFKGFVLLHI